LVRFKNSNTEAIKKEQTFRPRITTAGSMISEKQKYNTSSSFRVQSQKIARRPSAINQDNSYSHRIARLNLEKNENKNLNNLTDDLFTQNKENAENFVEYRSRKVIPLNMTNIGNMSAAEDTSNGAGKNLMRFQDAYTSPYSQQHTGLGAKPQYFNLRNRTKLSNRVGFFQPIANPSKRNMSYSAYSDAVLIPDQHLPQVVETENESQNAINDKQLIYIIPDGVDIIKDKYKIYKRDIKPYIDNMLPNKEEIEK
jgi:hypothetical protein